MNLSILLVLPALCLGAPPPPPDLSGTWVLDSAKSDLAGVPVPADTTIRIAVSGNLMRVTQTGGGQPEITLTLDTDGKEMTNEFPGGKMVSKHRWQAEILLGDTKLTADDGTSFTFIDKISISADGKVQTAERVLAGPAGEVRMKLVFNKRAD
jgi:hypothetical protein